VNEAIVETARSMKRVFMAAHPWRFNRHTQLARALVEIEVDGRRVAPVAARRDDAPGCRKPSPAVSAFSLSQCGLVQWSS
jgi:predicted dehydrogenase